MFDTQWVYTGLRLSSASLNIDQNIKCSPLRLALSFLKHIIFPVQVHDAILQMKLPLVPGSGDLVILTHNNILSVKQVARILIRDIILTPQRLLFHSLVIISIGIIVIIVVIVIIVSVIIVIIIHSVFITGVSWTIHLGNNILLQLQLQLQL